MSGTVEGGRKAALTNLSLYGNEFYRNIGRKGGKNSQASAKGVTPKRQQGRKIEVEFK